jgi:MHS family proline/betaine transporter-like MFS transporter
VYNAAFTIFGGFAPMILTWARQGSGGSIFVPAWYVMAAAAIALIAIPLLGRRNA